VSMKKLLIRIERGLPGISNGKRADNLLKIEP
jgi:hypothetical protein